MIGLSFYRSEGSGTLQASISSALKTGMKVRTAKDVRAEDSASFSSNQDSYIVQIR